MKSLTISLIVFALAGCNKPDQGADPALAQPEVSVAVDQHSPVNSDYEPQEQKGPESLDPGSAKQGQLFSDFGECMNDRKAAWKFFSGPVKQSIIESSKQCALDLARPAKASQPSPVESDESGPLELEGANNAGAGFFNRDEIYRSFGECLNYHKSVLKFFQGSVDKDLINICKSYANKDFEKTHS